MKKSTMRYMFAILFSVISITLFAQQKPSDLDKSPADISYCPQNYPILKLNGKITTAPVARLIYSRPQKTGREIFGGIVNYGEVWRLGANEATEIEFFKNVKINGKQILKGRYSMFAICDQTIWTIILNSEKDIWGLVYDPGKDVVRLQVPVQNREEITEVFTMYFDEVKGGANLNILWDTIKVVMPINY